MGKSAAARKPGARQRAPRQAPIRVGVSACLLGQRVRYDGRDKRDPWIARDLARDVEFIPLCPEVAIGLGVPRPPIQLVGNARRLRAVGVQHPELDVTAELARYGALMGRRLRGGEAISGYIFKSRSPSCGLSSVPVHSVSGRRTARASGVFASALRTVQGWLPVAEETDLVDPVRRESFIDQVLAYHHWQQLMGGGISLAKVERFHAAHRLIIAAHGPTAQRATERAWRAVQRTKQRESALAYLGVVLAALARPASRARHAVLIGKIIRSLSTQLDGTTRRELTSLQRAYRVGRTARAEVLRHIVVRLRRRPMPEWMQERYLFASRKEWRLRHEME